MIRILMFKFQSSAAVIIVPQLLSHPILFIYHKVFQCEQSNNLQSRNSLYGIPWKKEQEAWKYVTDTADGLISWKILAYNNFFFYERGLYQEHYVTFMHYYQIKKKRYLYTLV